MKRVEGQCAGSKRFPQGCISGVADEGFAEDLEGFLHADAEIAQGTSAFLLGDFGPSFEPARVRATGFAGIEPGGMGHEPEEDEVGEDFAREDGFEVEFEEGLA